MHHSVLTDLSPSLLRDLGVIYQAIERALPLNSAHTRELPHAVRDLSRLLTQERSHLDQPYWMSPRSIAAYCRYFLPWNLYRLGLLLPGLNLSLDDGDQVLDLGSGPLTLPLALWMTYPQLRSKKLTIVCEDTSPKPMQIGRDIFQAVLDASGLAAKDGTKQPPCPWKIELRRGPMEGILRALHGKAALITACNVLNELVPTTGRNGESPGQRLSGLTRLAASRLTPAGRILLVEPGNRLGGKIISMARQGAFSAGLLPVSPCPHFRACPMLARNATGWCHFSRNTGSGPAPLMDLTRRAKLEKTGLSLSYLLLRPALEDETRQLPLDLQDQDVDGAFDGPDDWDDTDFGDAAVPYDTATLENAYPLHPRAELRILSDPIFLPGLQNPARYACSDRGLVLVHGAGAIPSGTHISLPWPARETRDPKTGALVLRIAPERAEAPVRERTDRKDRTERPERGARPDRDGRTDRGGRPERGEGAKRDSRSDSGSAKPERRPKRDAGGPVPAPKRPRRPSPASTPTSEQKTEKPTRQGTNPTRGRSNEDRSQKTRADKPTQKRQRRSAPQSKER